MMNPTAPPPALLRLAGALFLFSASALAPAQEPLTLESILADPGEAAAPSSDSRAPLDETAARLLLQDIESLAAEGNLAEAADRSRALRARLDSDHPVASRALLREAQWLARLGRIDQAALLADQYLQGDIGLSDRVPAYALLAAQSAAAAEPDWNQAARRYAQLLEAAQATATPLDRGSLLGAAEAFVHTSDVERARIALDMIPVSADADPVHDFWQLEALLLADEPPAPGDIPPPAPEEHPLHAPIQLRRALLLELAGEEASAQTLYAELAWQRESLAPAGRALLDARAARFQTRP